MKLNNSKIKATFNIAVVAALFTGNAANAVEFPPIYDNVLRTPSTASSRIVSSYPKGTFLENIVIDEDGALIVTSYLDGKVLRITPTGKTRVIAKLPGRTSGIALESPGVYIVAVNPSTSLWRVKANGVVQKITDVKGANLNGITRLNQDSFLIADDNKGVIWQLNSRTNKVTLWSQDPLLAPNDPKLPIPGVNGLKIHAGYLYASNMQKNHMLRIKLNGDGSAGKAEVYKTGVFIDDFAIANNGDIYATTHPYNLVIRIAADDKRSLSVIAGREQGLQGATAIAFDKTQQTLYAVTNGGIYVPPSWGAVEANVVRIDLHKALGKR
jgi:sugar lactone lactonase YvrE